MAYVTKYNLTFKDHFQTQWDIDFQEDGFSGDITDLIGTGNPVTINYEASEHYTHSPIKASSVEIRLIETTDDSYLDFFTTDKAFKVKIYKGVDLFWQGWTVAEGYSSLYNLTPKSVTIIAVDGLTFLKSITLSVSETGTGAIDEPGIYNIYRYFKQAFDKIGLECNIYESLNLYDYRVNQSLSPITEHSIDTWAFHKNDDNEYETLYEILTRILTLWMARLYQKDGCWYIDHINQLVDGSITYRRYNSSFTYQASAAETRDTDITSKSGSPMIVPINHSLYKELERPVSKFVLNTNYNLANNIIRYKTDFEEVGVNTVQYDTLLGISSALTQGIQYTGIQYFFGRIDLSNSALPDKLMTVTVGGLCAGEVKVMLYILNDDDSTLYYYHPESEPVPFMPMKRWYEWIDSEDNSILSFDNDEYDEFNGSVDIYRKNPSIAQQDLKGPLYLLIQPPYYGETGSALTLDLEKLSVQYLECKRESMKYYLENSSLNTNERTVELYIYGNPAATPVYNDGEPWNQNITGIYINPLLSYPGIILYSDGSIYYPCRDFMFAGDSYKRLEFIITEDIMTFYASLRMRIIGTLKGAINFGNVLDYDSKRYMMASLAYSIKSAECEIVALQIGDLGSFLLNEDDTYILLEDGNKIII